MEKIESALKRLNPLTNIFLEEPKAEEFPYVFELFSVSSLSEILQIYKKSKKKSPSHHLIFLFESFRFNLCFVFLKNKPVDIQQLEQKLKDNEHNQITTILGLFLSLYKDKPEIEEESLDQNPLKFLDQIGDAEEFYEKFFIQENMEEHKSAKDSLIQFLEHLDERKKKLFYKNNKPTFFSSNIFGGFINDILVKVIQKEGNLGFNLMIHNHQEVLDRTKDMGSTKTIQLF